MRGLTRRWTIKPTVEPTAGLTLGPLPAAILAGRGFTTAQSVTDFCEPRLTHLHDPSAIPDLDIAADRLLQALRNREQIVIWGDYDVDGMTGAAIVHHIARAIAPEAKLRVHIPHRIDDGYGISSEGVRQLAAQGVTLIVTVDCGITAVEPAVVARELGIDLIITDHHSPPASIDDLPDAFAVAHPGRPDSTYPFADLCGAGVAYKLAWRVATLAAKSERVSEPIQRLLIDLLAYAALGTIADVVPLLDENRVIVKYGLHRIKATPFLGLQSLITASGLAGEHITSEDVGFRLAPRLNACGRMGRADDAMELLITESTSRAVQIAQSLTQLNDQRRAMEKTITEQAIALAHEMGMTGDDTRAIVLAQEDWSPGVIGIVCSRLVSEFGRPTVLMQRIDGICRGSCRSIDSFDIHDALSTCASHLESFGGHPMAAGLKLNEDQLEPFTQAFIECANSRITPAQLVPELVIDCETTLAELTPRAVTNLEKLGPFGRGNPPPVVLIRSCIIEKSSQTIGADGRHLSLFLRQDQCVMKMLAWGWGARRNDFRAGDRVDVVVLPKLNTWRGVVSVEPHLRDLAIVK